MAFIYVMSTNLVDRDFSSGIVYLDDSNYWCVIAMCNIGSWNSEFAMVLPQKFFKFKTNKTAYQP